MRGSAVLSPAWLSLSGFQLYLQLLPLSLFPWETLVTRVPRTGCLHGGCVSPVTGSEGFGQGGAGGRDREGTAKLCSCWGHVQGMTWHRGWGVKELGEEGAEAETLGIPQSPWPSSPQPSLPRPRNPLAWAGV